MFAGGARGGVVDSIPASQSGDAGSNPGTGVYSSWGEFSISLLRVGTGSTHLSRGGKKSNVCPSNTVPTWEPIPSGFLRLPGRKTPTQKLVHTNPALLPSPPPHTINRAWKMRVTIIYFMSSRRTELLGKFLILE